MAPHRLPRFRSVLVTRALAASLLALSATVPTTGTVRAADHGVTMATFQATDPAALADGAPDVRTYLFDPRLAPLEVGLALPTGNRGGLSVDYVQAGADPEGDSPSSMAWSPDGSLILISHWQSQNVIVWDAVSGAFVRSIDVSGSPLAIAVTPDGQHAVTANVFEDTASILDLATGAEVAVVPVGDQPGTVAISPDGTYAAVGNTVEGSISVIDIATATEVRRIAGIGFVGSISVNFENGSLAPSFRSFAFAGNDVLIQPDFYGGRVQFVDVTTGIVNNVVLSTGTHGVAVTPDGTTAVVINTNTETVHVFDVATQSLVRSIPLGSDAFNGAITINPTGDKAVVAVLNACVVVDLVIGTLSVEINTASVNDLYTTADGAYAFCVGFNGSLVSYATGTLVKNLNTLVSLSVGAVSPTEPRAAGAANSFGEDFLIFTTNGASGALQHHQLSGPDAEGDKSRQMALSPDGSVAAVTHILSDNVGIYDTATGALLAMLPVGDRPSEVAFTPDGQHAVVANLDSPFASVLDLTDFSVTNVNISTRASQVEISPDGAYAYLGVVTSDGVWRIDLSTNTVAGPRIPTGNMGSVGYLYNQSSGMTLSHDGRTLAVCGSFTNNVTVIDTDTWSVRANVPAATFPVRALFSGDDSKIYVTTRDNNRLIVIDNTPSVPVAVGNFLLGTQPYEMALSSDESFLYVINFQAHNVAEFDLEAGAVTRTFPFTDFAAGLAVSADGTQLYLPTGNWSVSFGPGPLFSQTVVGKLSVIDLATGTTVDEVDTGVMPGMLAVNGGRIAVPSTFVDGFYTTSVTDPASVGEEASAIRLAIGPNPTRSAVVAHASLPDGSGATASAVNVNGRVLRSWNLGRTSGDVELVWDLRDEHGNAVPAGVYWLRVQSGSSRITRSVVVR